MVHAGFWKLFAELIEPTAAQDIAPRVNRLYQNYPNPFNPSTRIDFAVATEELVAIEIFDVRGARVRDLLHETRSPGVYDVTWDGRDDSGRRIASGVYFYRLRIGSFTATKKMLMLK